ncbi:MAG: DUF6665 family protein [Kofleriaceae bacterium]|nr:DUF6665 family protein [Kofleriaceae bacterium]
MVRPVDPMQAIEHELQSERASALGEAGRALEKAVAALADTEESLDALATAVWNFLIVRESLKMFDHQAALDLYGVPRRVMARVGIVKPSP